MPAASFVESNKGKGFRRAKLPHLHRKPSNFFAVFKSSLKLNLHRIGLKIDVLAI